MEREQLSEQSNHIDARWFSERSPLSTLTISRSSTIPFQVVEMKRAAPELKPSLSLVGIGVVFNQHRQPFRALGDASVGVDSGEFVSIVG